LEARIALAACLVLGCALCGKSAADAVRRRANGLDDLSTGIRALRIHMTGMLENVQSALTHSGCGLMALVAQGMAQGRSAGEAWQLVKHRATGRGGLADALLPGDLAALDGLFDRLGQTGREEQALLLDTTLQAIDSLRGEARRRAGEADRLYLTIGLLVGLMLALMVI